MEKIFNKKMNCIVTVALFVIALSISINKMIVVKVPYEICDVMADNRPWFGEDDKFEIIEDMNELEEIFQIDDNIQWYERHFSEYFGINYDKYSQGLKQQRLQQFKKIFEEEKAKLLEEFKVENDFFENYYIIFVNDITGNTASKGFFDYITYNRVNSKLSFIKEDTRGEKIGGTVMSYSSFFVKIDKKYTGEVNRETKYVWFK